MADPIPHINFTPGLETYLKNHIAYINRNQKHIELGASYINSGVECGQQIYIHPIRYNHY